MIYGTGIDIIEVERVAQKIEKEGFLEKVFTLKEIQYCESKFNKAEHFAARFAAKEAFLKALGTGWQGEFPSEELEIVSNELGKPSFQFGEKLKKILEDRGIVNCHVSLSHVKQMAVASVILEK